MGPAAVGAMICLANPVPSMKGWSCSAPSSSQAMLEPGRVGRPGSRWCVSAAVVYGIGALLP
jgi:hypothetical protein